MHELQPLAVRDQAVCQRVGALVLRMARQLVVKSKTVARVANVAQAAFKIKPGHGHWRHLGQRPGFAVDGAQATAKQQVFDVCQQQFLVLLFVLQAQLDQAGHFAVVGQGQQLQDAFIDRFTPAQHLGQAGAGQQAALGARVFVAHGVVITVEQHLEGRVEGFETGLKTRQHKGLQKPGDVGQMPFDRAGVGHGLGLAVFGAQGGRQAQALGAHLDEALRQQAGGRGGLGVEVHHSAPYCFHQAFNTPCAMYPMPHWVLRRSKRAQWGCNKSQGDHKSAALAL